MNVLIRLKSRIVSQAMHELLKSSGESNTYCIDDPDCKPTIGKYDVIITDHNSLDFEFNSYWPEAKVLLLDTGLKQEEVISLLLSQKFYGVLSTNADASLMLKALGVVHRGQIWIDNDNLKALLFKTGIVSRKGTMGAISKREQQIIDLLVKGMNNKEIADTLFVSVQTVKAHLSRIFRKFNVTSRTQLVSILMKNNT